MSINMNEAVQDLLNARKRLGPAVMERHDIWVMLEELAASPKPDTEGVREALEDDIVSSVCREIRGAEWSFMDAAIRTGVRAALAAKPIAGMDAGEVA